MREPICSVAEPAVQATPGRNWDSKTFNREVAKEFIAE